MRWRDAFHHAMHVWRDGRIDLTEADRLVAGGAPGPGRPGLGALLAAVTAAPSAEELSGELAAVAGFAGVRRAGAPIGAAEERRRVRVRLSVGMAAMRVAVAVAVLTVGGTAAAAETGNLPRGLQRQAHDLFSPWGVPAPPSPTDRDGAGVSGPPTSPSARPAPGTAGPSEAATELGLCQAWDASRADPHNKTMTGEALHALAVAAGTDSAIPAFCAGLLYDNGKPGLQADPGHGKDRPVPTPSHPGGPGKAPPHPTPSPHR